MVHFSWSESFLSIGTPRSYVFSLNLWFINHFSRICIVLMSVTVGLIVKVCTDITFTQRVWPVVNLELNQILWAWHLMDFLFMAQLMTMDNSSHRKFHFIQIELWLPPKKVLFLSPFLSSFYLLFIPQDFHLNLLRVKLSHLNVRDGWWLKTVKVDVYRVKNILNYWQ